MHPRKSSSASTGRKRGSSTARTTDRPRRGTWRTRPAAQTPNSFSLRAGRKVAVVSARATTEPSSSDSASTSSSVLSLSPRPRVVGNETGERLMTCITHEASTFEMVKARRRQLRRVAKHREGMQPRSASRARPPGARHGMTAPAPPPAAGALASRSGSSSSRAALAGLDELLARSTRFQFSLLDQAGRAPGQGRAPPRSTPWPSQEDGT